MDTSTHVSIDETVKSESHVYRLAAYKFAEKTPIKEAVNAFLDRLVVTTNTDANFRLGPDSYFGVYSFGSVTFFNVPQAQQDSVLERLAAISTKLEGELTSDDFIVTVSTTQRESVHFDRAVIADLSPAKIQILSTVLAESATMEYYENAVEDLLDRSETVTTELRTGRLPRYTRWTLQYIGMSLSTRRDLVSSLYIVDAPESTWEDRKLDRLYTQMKATMDIDVRYRALEYKLKLIQESVELIVDLTNTQRNIQLEVAIVLLIVVEIALAFFGLK